MIRLGLIGAGKWGWVYAKSAVEAGNAKVTHVHRVSARHKDNAWVQGYLSEAKVVDDWRDMVNEPVDAFCVATPPGTHAEICAHLLELGRPVMVEKPMTLDVPKAYALQQIAAKSGAPFLVDYVHLFNPAFLRLRDIFLDLKPSRCRISSRGGGDGPYRDYSALWDYGPHDLSMCLALGLGVVTYVHGIRSPQASHEGKEGCHFDLTVGFGPSEAHVQVWNAALPKSRWFEVCANGHRLVYDDTVSTLGIEDRWQLRHNNVPVKDVDTSQVYPHAHAVRAFAEAVKTGRTDWRFGVKDSVTIAHVLHTAETGTVHA